MPAWKPKRTTAVRAYDNQAMFCALYTFCTLARRWPGRAEKVMQKGERVSKGGCKPPTDGRTSKQTVPPKGEAAVDAPASDLDEENGLDFGGRRDESPCCYSFASPFITSLNSFNPSTAKATIFPSLSPPNPVSASFVDVPFSVATARATYPLQNTQQSAESPPSISKLQLRQTYGVLFLVLAPVGPAVPLSQIQYVAPSVPLTFSARPFTTSSVGPLYAALVSSVHPAKAIRDSSVYSVKPPL